MFGFRRKSNRTQERWTAMRELETAGLLPDEGEPGGIVLGEWRDPKGGKRILRHRGPDHVLVIAPCRSGKTTGITIPTLLSWDESVLVFDVKGESYEVTRNFRERRLGQRVLRFEPGAPNSARFNPLSEIRLDRNLVRDAAQICGMLMNPAQDEHENHWTRCACHLLTAITLYVRLSQSPDGLPDGGSLATVRAILTDGGPLRGVRPVRVAAAAEDCTARTMLASIREMAEDWVSRAVRGGRLAPSDKEHEARLAGWQAVAEILEHWSAAGNAEFGSVIATAKHALTIFADPAVAANTSESDFSIDSLVAGSEKVSLYITASPLSYPRHQALSKLLVDMVIRRRLEALGANGSKSRLLLLIDDIGVFGRLPVLVNEGLAGFSACAVTGLFVTQSRAQISKTFWETEAGSIVGNCAIQVAYAPNTLETATFFGARSALSVEEIMRTPEDEALFFVPGCPPFRCGKVEYYRDEPFRTRANGDSGKLR